MKAFNPHPLVRNLSLALLAAISFCLTSGTRAATYTPQLPRWPVPTSSQLPDNDDLRANGDVFVPRRPPSPAVADPENREGIPTRQQIQDILDGLGRGLGTSTHGFVNIICPDSLDAPTAAIRLKYEVGRLILAAFLADPEDDLLPLVANQLLQVEMVVRTSPSAPLMAATRGSGQVAVSWHQFVAERDTCSSQAHQRLRVLFILNGLKALGLGAADSHFVLWRLTLAGVELD